MDYNEAINLDPEDSDLYCSRGICKSDSGDIDGGIADQTIAIKLNPNSSSAYICRANRFHEKGNFEAALEDYYQAIQLDPHEPIVYNNRGCTYASDGQYNLAVEDFNKALSMRPRYSRAMHNRAIAKYGRGDVNDALSDFEKACTLDKPSIYSTIDLYVLQSRTGRTASPQLLKKAFAASKYKWEKCIIQFLQGKLTEAELLTAANQGTPYESGINRCDAFYYIGMTYIIKNDMTQGKSWLEKCQATRQFDIGAYKLAVAELRQLARTAAK